MASRMKALYNQVIFERRVLLGCTILIGLAVCIWAVAICTDHWYTVESPISEPKGLLLRNTDKNGRTLVYRNQGLWRDCITGFETPPDNKTGELKFYQECKRQEMFPTEENIMSDFDFDATVLSYARTQVSFAIISMIVMLMGFSFSIYTFRNPRYMFKRLAGGIHFISGACVMVVIQVVLSSMEYGSKNTVRGFPKGSSVHYGFSLVLAWFVCIGNLLAGCSFILFSKKRKRDKAPTEELAMADEPTIIGR
ncbi:uncharacterized protein LOC130662976 [Microplitis mediator]|uniref:uncharacterized protein LOC130662976 n=1 Tax=Microplitis mediator TaxID=375433 RepID=UPI0025551ABA|nr:uncharacterized protein LOC130662976 [Microplitis mediator]